VCIALVVTRDGFPLGYEVFDGNRTDVTTVEEIVEEMEDRYGAASRVWVMDRGMVSQSNVEFLRGGGRRYIVGAPRGMLRRFERQILEGSSEVLVFRHHRGMAAACGPPTPPGQHLGADPSGGRPDLRSVLVDGPRAIPGPNDLF
jgi:hypothetical protein